MELVEAVVSVDARVEVTTLRLHAHGAGERNLELSEPAVGLVESHQQHCCANERHHLLQSEENERKHYITAAARYHYKLEEDAETYEHAANRHKPEMLNYALRVEALVVEPVVSVLAGDRVYGVGLALELPRGDRLGPRVHRGCLFHKRLGVDEEGWLHRCDVAHSVLLLHCPFVRAPGISRHFVGRALRKFGVWLLEALGRLLELCGECDRVDLLFRVSTRRRVNDDLGGRQGVHVLGEAEGHTRLEGVGHRLFQ